MRTTKQTWNASNLAQRRLIGLVRNLHVRQAGAQQRRPQGKGCAGKCLPPSLLLLIACALSRITMRAGARRAGRRLCRRLDDLVHLFILVPAFRAVEEGARRGPRAEIAPAAGCSSCSLPVFGRRGPREQARRDLPHRPRGGAGALPPEHRPQPSRARRRPAPHHLQPLEQLLPRQPRCGRAYRRSPWRACLAWPRSRASWPAAGGRQVDPLACESAHVLTHSACAAGRCATFHPGSSGCSTSAYRLSFLTPIQRVRNQCA